MHQSVQPPIEQSVLGFEASNPEWTVQVMFSAAPEANTIKPKDY